MCNMSRAENFHLICEKSVQENNIDGQTWRWLILFMTNIWLSNETPLERIALMFWNGNLSYDMCHIWKSSVCNFLLAINEKILRHLSWNYKFMRMFSKPPPPYCTISQEQDVGIILNSTLAWLVCSHQRWIIATHTVDFYTYDTRFLLSHFMQIYLRTDNNNNYQCLGDFEDPLSKDQTAKKAKSF